MNKEEFLDKKNADLIREMKGMFELKSELESTWKYIRDMERESDLPTCELYCQPSKDMPKVGYSVLQIAMNLSKAYFEGDLVERKKPISDSSCTETNLGRAKLYLVNEHGDYYELNEEYEIKSLKE